MVIFAYVPQAVLAIVGFIRSDRIAFGKDQGLVIGAGTCLGAFVMYQLGGRAKGY
jgi:hypothetical protein